MKLSQTDLNHLYWGLTRLSHDLNKDGGEPYNEIVALLARVRRATPDKPRRPNGRDARETRATDQLTWAANNPINTSST